MPQERLFHRNQRLEIVIDDLAFEGKGIAKIQTEKGQFVVFVPNTIPGQTVQARVIKAKKTYAETKLERVLKRSPVEVEQPYYPIPGAPYITLPIAEQHRYKRQTTIELFRRIGKLEKAEALLDAFIPSPELYHYRNKMEYSFSAVGYNREKDENYDGFALGFKKRGQWLAVEPLQKDSGLFDKELEDAMPKIQAFFRDRNHSGWHGKHHSGFCRFLMVKKSYATNSLLVNLTTSSSELDRFDKKGFTALIKDILGDRLAGLLHTVNDDLGDRPNATDGEREVLYGKGELIENICGLEFRISPESFFQTNPRSAERLYTKALDYVFESEADDKPVILDLFSGTGTITQLLAQRSRDKTIIGVEIVPEAVEDARSTATLNGLDNLDFYANDVGKFLLENPHYSGQIGTLIMDPPRAGIAPKTLRKIIRLGAERMVYISCNPATQARDMVTLEGNGYHLKKYSLVDQFPHTAHIESVGLFERG